MAGITSGIATGGVSAMGGMTGAMTGAMTTGMGEGLMQDTFTQKSQSLRQQMQLVNDKLFETDKLLSMQNYLRK